ncbi:hypothetical protein [Radicibacter daui]|uniref:hypothetical protein n=1 Tax=Radicibacter daui TaxID=3064829 RepID=UPI004046C336
MFRLNQTQDMPAGIAALHCPNTPLDPQSVEFCVGHPLPGGGRHHLDPANPDQPWGAAEIWQRPAGARQEGNLLILTLDAFTTFHLKPNQPFFVTLRDGNGGRTDGPVIGIALRLPSAPPRGWKPTSAPAAQPAPAITAEPAPPLEPLTAPALETGPAPTGRSPLPLIGGIALVLLLLGGTAAWWFLGRPADTSQQAETLPAPNATPMPPAEEFTLASARSALAGKPDAAAALALGKAHLAAKDLDGAFLLLRNSAEQGNPEAAAAVGGLYDPDGWSKDTSPLPAPNAEQAAQWYRKAAEAGDAEAQYRLAMVLKSGKTDAQDGPEQAISWLRKAADQGHVKAKEALGE